MVGHAQDSDSNAPKRRQQQQQKQQNNTTAATRKSKTETLEKEKKNNFLFLSFIHISLSQPIPSLSLLFLFLSLSSIIPFIVTTRQIPANSKLPPLSLSLALYPFTSIGASYIFVHHQVGNLSKDGETLYAAYCMSV